MLEAQTIEVTRQRVLLELTRLEAQLRDIHAQLERVDIAATLCGLDAVQDRLEELREAVPTAA